MVKVIHSIKLGLFHYNYVEVHEHRLRLFGLISSLQLILSLEKIRHLVLHFSIRTFVLNFSLVALAKFSQIFTILDQNQIHVSIA